MLIVQVRHEEVHDNMDGRRTIDNELCLFAIPFQYRKYSFSNQYLRSDVGDHRTQVAYVLLNSILISWYFY